LCLRENSPEKIREAFTYVEAAKSRTLVDLLAKNLRPKAKGTNIDDPDLFEQWNRLQEELDWLYNKVNQHEAKGDRRPAELDTYLESEIKSREQQLTKLLRRLQIADAEYASLQTASALNLAALSQVLAADEVLVEYFIAHEKVKVFLVGRDAVHAINPVTEARIVAERLLDLRFQLDKVMLQRRYVETHLATFQQSVSRCLEQLYAELIAPIETWIQGKDLVVIPHGLLHYIPFHALSHQGHYLSDQCAISYAPSASVFKLCRERAAPESHGALLLGVADTATPHLHDEIEAIKSLLPQAELLLNEEATVDRFKQVARQCRFLHLACHGVFRDDNPLFSSLKLADRWLNFYDLFNLDLDAELVTLSACHTGVNHISPGDELLGIMRGFLHAGVPSLILSLWAVDDRSTCDFMKHFYSALKKGVSKRSALRQAQVKTRADYPHPYYWAPFILIGKPD